MEVGELVNDFGQEGRLQQRFPAGEGDAAAVAQERGLAVEEGGQFYGGVTPARQALSSRVAEALRRGGQALGIMAPSAAQGAAFEEHGGPDAGPIVNRQLTDIENQAGHWRSHFFQFCSV